MCPHCVWSRTLQRQLTFANNEKRCLALASKLPTGNSHGVVAGEEEGGEKGPEVWEAKEVLGNLGWYSQCCGKPDLPQGEQQARVGEPLSPGSPETPRCSGKNPGGGDCPEPSSQALPHTSPLSV